MSDMTQPTIAELMANRELMLAAVNRGIRDALLRHAQAGNPVATWRDDRVVWLQPAEVFALLDASKGKEPSSV
jgi:hypothetical protein